MAYEEQGVFGVYKDFLRLCGQFIPAAHLHFFYNGFTFSLHFRNHSETFLLYDRGTKQGGQKHGRTGKTVCSGSARGVRA